MGSGRGFSQYRGLWCVLALTGLSGLLSGCFTNNLRTAGLATYDASTVDGASPTASDDGVEYITLSRVVKTANSTGISLDLIGDGVSNAMGTYCVAQASGGSGGSSGSSTDGASTCQCVYSYTANGSSQEVNVDTTYHENNLLRCPYRPQVPDSVSEVKVKVYISTMGGYSNEITLKLSGTGFSADPTDTNTFAEVQRYQCRDAVVIPSLLDSEMYDPILSESKMFSYPLNFYTTNMGGTLAYYINNTNARPQNGVGWICPTSPTPSLTDYDEIMSLTVYSQMPEEGSNSKMIYNFNAAKNPRSTFHLARTPTSVFTVPINTYIAPATATDGDKIPVLGYGAAPVRLSADTETCPDSSVQIPSGYQWVKVWPFRASVAARSKIPGSDAIQKLGYVGCNPGSMTKIVDGKSIEVPVVPDCCLTYSGTGPTFCADPGWTANELTELAPLIDRFYYTPSGAKCFRVGGQHLDLGGGNYCISDMGNTAGTGGDGTVYPSGTDIWAPAEGAQEIRGCNSENNPADFETFIKFFENMSCASTKNDPFTDAGSTSRYNIDPLNICENYSSGHEGTGAQSVPYTTTTNYREMDNRTSRFDIIYVVSPTTLNTKDMRDATSAAMPYYPYRFYMPDTCANGDFSEPDPDNPSVATSCKGDRIDYYFDNRDVTVADTGQDPEQNRKFPICALQPI